MTLDGMETTLPSLTKTQLQDVQARTAVKFAMCVADARRRGESAFSVFREKFPNSIYINEIERSMQEAVKGAVSAITPGDFGIQLPRDMQMALVASSMPFSAFARIPGFTSVPFDVPISPTVTPFSGFAWIGSGRPLPVSSAAFDQFTLQPATVGGILVFSQELLRLFRTNTDRFLRDEFARALAAFVDRSFVDETNAGTSDAPAAVTYGVTAIPSVGVGAGEIQEDLANVLSAYADSGGSFSSAVFLLSSSNAIAMKLLDPDRYRELNRDGGVLVGLPAVCSDSIGDRIIVLDASRLAIADEGGVSFAVSTNATVEMRDDPVQAATDVASGGSPAAPTPVESVSMFQTNSSALRILRTVNWKMRDSGGIAWVSDAHYAFTPTAGSPA